MAESPIPTRCASTSTAKETAVVSLESLCWSRLEPVEHVRALVRAGRLPIPAGYRADGAELVPRDYFALSDAAGGVRELPAYFHEVYAPRLQLQDGLIDGRTTDECWELYLAGKFATEDPASPSPEPEKGSWAWHLWRELRRVRDGEGRLAGADGPRVARRREQQLMRVGSAAWGVGLTLLMLGREGEARSWLHRSATCYRRCLAEAEPGSWGRSIGALKARLIAGDRAGARREAEWTLDLGADDAASPIGRYAACLAFLTLGDDQHAHEMTVTLNREIDFPAATGAACSALASGDEGAYVHNIVKVLQTFEERLRFLEDIPVADTVLALQVLAEERSLHVPLRSRRLPDGTDSGLAT